MADSAYLRAVFNIKVDDRVTQGTYKRCQGISIFDINVLHNIFLDTDNLQFISLAYMES